MFPLQVLQENKNKQNTGQRRNTQVYKKMKKEINSPKGFFQTTKGLGNNTTPKEDKKKTSKGRSSHA